jgi:ATP-dependent Lhr-like helicase
MAALSRVVPISLVLREELSFLLAPRQPASPSELRSGAQQVLEALAARGALFFNELSALAGLLPGHLDEALRERAALGLITSDAFGAVRRIAGGEKPRGRRRVRRPTHGLAAPVGRWSLFPGPVEPAPHEQHLDHWCRLLLRRYGVVFRDVLARETSAPAWHELVHVLRRMELRGEVRGGRFVSQVSGEQYALPETIERLRQARDETVDSRWVVISAADPVNLFGIITPGPRIAATHRNALVVSGGRLVAARQAGVAQFHQQVDPATEWSMRQAMTTGRRAEDNAKPDVVTQA